MVGKIIEIGGDRYLIDPQGKGEYLLPEDAPAHLEAQELRPADIIPGRVREYETPSGDKREKPVRLCAYPGCGKRAKEKWCSEKHRNSYRARLYRRRRKKIKSWVETANGIPLRFERPWAPSFQKARKRFVEHLADGVCQFADDSGQCPSMKNPYNVAGRPRCLIYATYADDLIMWQARIDGFGALRRYTTQDGRWLKVAVDTLEPDGNRTDLS